MSPKAGRPFSDNPKAERLYIRVTAEEKKRIMDFCDEHKVSALDLIRKGMDTIKKYNNWSAVWRRPRLFYSPKPHGLRLNLIIDAAPAKVNSFPQGIFALIFGNPPSESLDTAYSIPTTKDYVERRNTMNELSIIHKNGVDVIDSREVAEAIGKQHAHLMRDIHNYAEVIEKSNESNFGLVDFFIPSTYTDTKGEERPCYLLTKKGCDMVANKMTGEKGVLFTAAYVTAFEKMRETVTSPTMIPGLSPQTQALINMELRQNRIEAEQREQKQAFAGLSEDQRKTKNVVMTALSTFAAAPTDEERWRDVMNRKVRTMCEEYGLNYHTTIGEMYAELERRAHVNLSVRQKNLRERMRLGGAKYAQREAVSKLVVISQDAKLRYIYEAIVREKAAQLAASRMR